MAKPDDSPATQYDYIACDLPTEMTLEQFRRARCVEHRRFLKLRELSVRWLSRHARDD
jgi:hypothetical protein